MADFKKLPPLSEAQLEIMDVVWDRGEVTVGDGRAPRRGTKYGADHDGSTEGQGLART